MNNQIIAPELRLIDEQGKNLGIFKKEDALNLAKEKGLDLIEIAPMGKPPVARIISFDKFRYQKEKENKKQWHTQKIKDLKHIRITPRAAKNDLQIKAGKVDEFLKDGYKVEIVLRMKGREKGNKDWSRQKLNEFMTLIKSPHQVTMEAKFSGIGFVTQISPK